MPRGDLEFAGGMRDEVALQRVAAEAPGVIADEAELFAIGGRRLVARVDRLLEQPADAGLAGPP